VETQERIENSPMNLRLTDAKDELNLAEFPLCVLGHRARPEQKTLHFEDRIWDQGRGEQITRRLTVTGSDAYGLPTALDDEVLLGLIQLSKGRGFAERKVAFTRYQLLQLLNWRQDSKNYERLETSLNRWTGVTLVYANAWWNKDRITSTGESTTRGCNRDADKPRDRSRRRCAFGGVIRTRSDRPANRSPGLAVAAAGHTRFA